MKTNFHNSLAFIMRFTATWKWPVGLIAQLVEHCTGIADVKGFESRSSLHFFFRLSFRSRLSCVHNCDSLSFTQSVLCLLGAGRTEKKQQLYMPSNGSARNKRYFFETFLFVYILGHNFSPTNSQVTISP